MIDSLPNENPKERSLRHHPIHGQGWVDENGFRNVNNYIHPHIRAKNTPRRIWPENAADWGLQLWVPSQTDMTPGARSERRRPRPHPVLVNDGEYEWEVMDYSDAYAAFYYTYVHHISQANNTEFPISRSAPYVDHAASPTGKLTRTPTKS